MTGLTAKQQEALRVYELGNNDKERGELMSEPIGERNYRYLRSRAIRAQAQDLSQIDGFQATSVSQQFDGDGNLKGESIRSAPAPEIIEDPINRRVVRTSINRDGAGNVKQHWQIYGPEGQPTPDEIAEAVKKALETVPEPRILVDGPKNSDADLCNLVPIADSHLGMKSYTAKTGEKYDLSTAVNIHLDAASDMLSRAPRAALCVLLDLGDGTHQNDSRGVTSRSGHILELDAPYGDTLIAAAHLDIGRVEMALQTHDHVEIRKLPGNHDEDVSLAVAMALQFHFQNNPRVTVILDQGFWYFKEWGINLIAGTHGHKIKPNKMKSYLTDSQPEMWGRSKYRHVFYGHEHSENVISDGACIIERCNTLAAASVFEAGSYTGYRSAFLQTLHKDFGPYGRTPYLLRETI